MGFSILRGFMSGYSASELYKKEAVPCGGVEGFCL